MYAMTNSAGSPARAPMALRLQPVSRALDGAGQGDPLDRLGAVARFEKNRSIYFEGDEAEHCYKVRSGTVRLCKVTEDGRRQIAAFLTAGDLFGWTDRDVYNFSAEAVTDVVLEKFSRARIEEAVKANPGLGRRVLGVLSGQLASAHEHLLLLGRMTAAERIAAFLLDLVRRQHGAASIELTMCRKDVADYLGLTVETVSRTMSALKRKGIIAFTEPEHVELRQNTTLERLAMAA
jgi:CRP/FNR family nitrogen fixation transcriptional regulator